MSRPKASPVTAPPHRGTRRLKKILVALDGSPEGEAILGHLRLLLPPGSVVILIHVVPTPAPSSEGEVVGLLRMEGQAERYLESIQERLPQLRSRWIVETGDPTERILAAAREEDVDALALTTHARSGLTSLLLGSVARGLVQRAARPVLLVRPDVPAPTRPHRKILVPLAGPEGADTVLSVVEPLAKQTDSEIVLLHVLPFPRVADPVTGFNPIVLRPMELPRAAWLDPLVDLLAHHGVRAVASVLAGEPDEVVLRESRSSSLDLIALRTRGRGGLARLLLGSVAERLLRSADRPLLLLHRVDRR